MPGFNCFGEIMAKVLFIGSACVDITINVDHLPTREEDVNPKGQFFSMGGCAFNASEIARQLKIPYSLFSPVGKGVYGEYVRKELASRGIKPMIESDEENGCCYCIVDEEGYRTFLAIHGTEYLFQKQWFSALNMHDYDYIYVCGLELEEKTGNIILDFLRRQENKTIFFAPGSRIEHLPRTIIESISSLRPIVHLNKREAGIYAGQNEHRIEKIHEMTGRPVIMTDGANPVTVIENHNVYQVETVRAKQVDGTGAGDAHIGAIISFLHQGFSLKEAVKKANRISAAVCGVKGAGLSEEQFQRITL